MEKIICELKKFLKKRCIISASRNGVGQMIGKFTSIKIA